MTASCHYINTAMKDIKKEFFEGPASYSISGCDLEGSGHTVLP